MPAARVGEAIGSVTDGRESVAVLPTERLEAEITELAGQLAAGECRWLLLVADFDRREAWKPWGCASIVHWLGWQCGLDARSARERVRVARALLEFAAVREAFAAGVLTYSKVRAITRVVTRESESTLVEMARHATAAQIERIVAGYRRMGDADRAEAADQAYVRRRVDTFHDPDCFTVRLRTTHDDGAAFRGAFGQLVDESLRDRTLAEGETAAQRRADVLVAVVVRAAQGDHGTPSTAATSPADRHLVVVNVDATVLAADDGAVCELDGGPGLPAETARRIACDAEIVGLVRDADGAVVGIGRAARRPPQWLRRRLHARDQGCRFPGCGARRVVHAHHVRHWTRGGPTDLANLVELCPFHHRLVHEGGWTVHLDDRGTATFVAPDATTVSSATRPGGGSAEPPADLATANARRGISVGPATVAPDHLDPLDLDLALTALIRPGHADPYHRN